jgi:hypothetical protein
MEPQYVCGAATLVGARPPKASQDTRPTAGDARTRKAEKNNKPLTGAVCSLTKGGLIRVRPCKTELPRVFQATVGCRNRGHVTKRTIKYVRAVENLANCSADTRAEAVNPIG